MRDFADLRADQSNWRFRPRADLGADCDEWPVFYFLMANYQIQNAKVCGGKEVNFPAILTQIEKQETSP